MTQNQTQTQSAVTRRADPEKDVVYKPFGAADEIRLSIRIVQNLVAVRTKSGKTCNEWDAAKFIMLCQAQRLNPFAGDAWLVGYDGRDGIAKFSLITAELAFLKRAETSPDYDGLESGVIIVKEDGSILEREGDFYTDNENVQGGWCKVYRKNRRNPTYKRLAISQRKPPYETPFWEGHKAVEQIIKCAEVDALRFTFPTLLGGLYAAVESAASVETYVAGSLPAGAVTDVKGLVETTAPVPGKPAEFTGHAGGRYVEGQPGPQPAEATGRGPTPGEQAQSGQGPTPPAPPVPAKAAQAELADFVTQNGFTFDHLRQWAMEGGGISGADTLGGFDEVPEKDAVRLLRAKVGLLRALSEIKQAQPQKPQ